MTDPRRITLKTIEVRRLDAAANAIARLEEIYAKPLAEYRRARLNADQVLDGVLKAHGVDGDRAVWDLGEEGDDVVLVERVKPEEEPGADDGE